MKFLFFVLTYLATVSAGERWIPVSKDDASWLARFESNVNNTKANAANINVIFYGDSITEGWGITALQLWNQHYAPLGAANYGIRRDLVENLLWRVMNGELDDVNLRPKLVVLKIGTNNINLNCSVENDIARGIIQVVEEIRRILPSTRVLVLGVLPRDDATTTDQIERINAAAVNVDDGSNIRFFNMRDAFFNASTRQLFTELYRGDGDLLHLSLAGYERWQQTMNTLFQQMMSA